MVIELLVLSCPFILLCPKRPSEEEALGWEAAEAGIVEPRLQRTGIESLDVKMSRELLLSYFDSSCCKLRKIQQSWSSD